MLTTLKKHAQSIEEWGIIMMKPTYTIAIAAIFMVAAFAGIAMVDDEADAEPAAFTQVVYKIDENNVKADTVTGDTFVAKSPEELGLTFKGTFQYWSCGDLVFVPGQTYSTTLEGASNGSITLTAKVMLPTTVAIVNGDDTKPVTVDEVVNTIKGINTESEDADFAGWLYSKDNKVYILNEAKDKLVTIDANKTEIVLEAGETLTAQYEKIFKITWYANNVKAGEGTTAVGGDIGMPDTDPDMDNYVFLGWYDANGVKYDENYKFTGDTEFTAKYQPVNFTVTFNMGDFSKEVLVPYNTTVAPIQLDAGYSGWATKEVKPVLDEEGNPVLDEEGKPVTEDIYTAFDFSTKITENIELYAVAAEVIPDDNLYVTFNIEGVTYGPYVVSERFSIPQTDREGYNFLGWTVEGGDGTKLTSAQVQNYEYTEDVTFVAVYEVAEPPAPEEPAFYETSMGQIAIVIVIFAILAFGYGAYSNAFGLKDKLFGYTIQKKEKKE